MTELLTGVAAAAALGAARLVARIGAVIRESEAEGLEADS